MTPPTHPPDAGSSDVGTRRIRVVLVDDHALFREGVASILRADGRLEVVGQGASGAEAVRLVRELRPDVLLLDVEMPGDDVTTTLQRLRATVPETRVLVLTMHQDARLVRRLLAMGATAYLVKSLPAEALVAIVVANAVDGGSPDELVSISVPRSSLPHLGRTEESGSPLTARETEIMLLAAEACSNTTIAERLSISVGTVKRHMTNIFAKLEAESRIDAVRKARAAGALPDGM